MQDVALGEEIGVVHEMGSVPQTAANTGIDRFLARDRVYDIYFRISSGGLPDITEPLHRDLNAGHRYLNAELGGVWGRAEPPERIGRPYPRVRKFASDAAHPATPCLHDQQVGFYAKKMFIEVELPLPLGKLTKRQEQVSPFFPEEWLLHIEELALNELRSWVFQCFSKMPGDAPGALLSTMTMGAGQRHEVLCLCYVATHHRVVSSPIV